MALPLPQAHTPVKSAIDKNINAIQYFLYGMGHKKLDISLTNEKLEMAMLAEMYERKIQCRQLQETLHLAASLIEVGYHRCTFEEKKAIAMYNWLAIYVDDRAPKNVGPFAVFQKRFLLGLPQLDPVLTAFADVIISLYDHYDVFVMNTILTATFDFVNSSCMEPTVESLPLIREAESFPWYLRDQTGIGKAFTLFMFTKSSKVAITDYIQAIPNMNHWISCVNDFLSFHKEELAGETANYIHNRAHVESIAAVQIHADMGREVLEERMSILTILGKSPHAMELWQIWERGYIGWHLAQDRYKLKDLGL